MCLPRWHGSWYATLLGNGFRFKLCLARNCTRCSVSKGTSTCFGYCSLNILRQPAHVKSSFLTPSFFAASTFAFMSLMTSLSLAPILWSVLPQQTSSTAVKSTFSFLRIEIACLGLSGILYLPVHPRKYPISAFLTGTPQSW